MAGDDKDGSSSSKNSAPWSPSTADKLKSRGYVIGKKIGYGSYSNVYKGKKGDKEIAVKVIDLSKASKNYREKFFPREMKLMRQMKHRYMVTTLDIFKETGKNEKCFIFMELAKTDLLSVIEKQKKVDEKTASNWFFQVSSALEYLHSNKYCHRDLKVENILISFKNEAMISDFGFARETANNVLSETYCGSVQYASPQILANHAYNPFAADVWSLGICIYATIIGKMPFASDKTIVLREEQKNVQKIVSKCHCSSPAKDLLAKMLKYQEGERINMKQVLKHDWFKVYNK